MKYTKTSTFTVVSIVATLLAAGLVTAISTANEADATHQIINNQQTAGAGGAGSPGGTGGTGGSNTVRNTQTTTCVNGVCTTS
jgi:hypothetical protein